MIKKCETCTAEFKGRKESRFCSRKCNPYTLTESQRKAGVENLKNLDSNIQSQRRLRQIAHEESEANKLCEQGYEVFSPTVVCDRIAIKDGKVYFVEFKKPGQTLRPGQQKIQAIDPDKYLILYADTQKQ